MFRYQKSNSIDALLQQAKVLNTVRSVSLHPYGDQLLVL